jgi:hypothetical protein
VGKSTLALDWAARVSTSSPWPDGARPPIGDVLILSAEDGIADAIRPRIDAAGGDPARVHVLTEVRESTQDGRGGLKIVLSRFMVSDPLIDVAAPVQHPPAKPERLRPSATVAPVTHRRLRCASKLSDLRSCHEVVRFDHRRSLPTK